MYPERTIVHPAADRKSRWHKREWTTAEELAPERYGAMVSTKQPQSVPEVATMSHSPADGKLKPLG